MNFIKKWQIKHQCQKGMYPKFICEYYKDIFEHDTLKKKPYEDIRYVVLDTETTGLDIKKDNLLSIGAIVIQNKAILVEEVFEVILDQPRDLKEETVRVHGLTREDLRNGMPAEEAIKAFFNYLRADVIVAHHTFFDVTMLNKSIAQFISPNVKLINLSLDTATLAKQIDFSDNPYGQSYQYNLDALCKRYNLDMHDRHTAWGDALITAKLFLVLTRILEKKGYKTLNDLLKVNPS